MFRSKILPFWNATFSELKTLTFASWKEKIALCVFFGFTYAALNGQSLEEFVDKFIAGVIYCFWALFILPNLTAKLNVQLLWDAGAIFFTTYAADMMYFGLYRHAKKLWSAESNQAIVDHWLIFVVNVVRITACLFCLVISISAFMKNTFPWLPDPKPKKDAPSPHKMKRRSTARKRI
jgi:hypothetical protein